MRFSGIVGVFILITFPTQSVMIHSNAAPNTMDTSSVLLTWTSPADTGDVTFTCVSLHLSGNTVVLPMKIGEMTPGKKWCL